VEIKFQTLLLTLNANVTCTLVTAITWKKPPKTTSKYFAGWTQCSTWQKYKFLNLLEIFSKVCHLYSLSSLTAVQYGQIYLQFMLKFHPENSIFKIQS